ncbi:MAG: lamin tail domain-containing protein [Anaerolineae bacterium]|nr:MAG: lamin tail domain-containing protein [Anaerolineae bacterium]
MAGVVQCGAAAVDLAGWTLRDGGDINLTLHGTLPAGGFFFERTDDTTVNDIPADLIYTGSLGNSGETLTLRNASDQVVDTANGDGGAWPGGSAALGYLSMERIDAWAPDSDGNWASNDGITRNGHAANGDPINGTPRQPNSASQPSPTPSPTPLSHRPRPHGDEHPTATPTPTPTPSASPTALRLRRSRPVQPSAQHLPQNLVHLRLQLRPR